MAENKVYITQEQEFGSVLISEEVISTIAYSSAKDVEGRKPGVGLGLALSRDIARSIGGELTLEKSDEHGSAFTLTLPL